jgi:hypothetical protein
MRDGDLGSSFFWRNRRIFFKSFPIITLHVTCSAAIIVKGAGGLLEEGCRECAYEAYLTA